MKNKKINSKAFNLAGYAALAGSFLALSKETTAQAVYVDINPDTVLTGTPFAENLVIELNGTVLFDFLFGALSGTYYADWCECFQFEQIVNLSGTESKVVYTNYQFTSDQYLVSALEPGVIINADLNFQDNDTKMAYKVIPDWPFYYAFEGGAWLPETIDKYIGIRFTDSLDCMHYGWIRCSVEDNGTKLTVKDYAYETKCDVGIVAGDTIGDTTVPINEINSLDAVVYNFNKVLNIKTDTYDNCTCIINSIQGQQLLQSELSENLTQIDMTTFPAGIYIVRLVHQNSVFIKEVTIH